MENTAQTNQQSISNNKLQIHPSEEKQSINNQIQQNLEHNMNSKIDSNDSEKQDKISEETKQNSNNQSSNFGELEAFLNLLFIEYKKQLSAVEKNKAGKTFNYDDVNLNQMRYDFFINVKEQLRNHEKCFQTHEEKMKYLLNFFTNLDKIESGIKLKIKNFKVRVVSQEMDSKNLGELISKINNLIDQIIEHIQKLEVLFGITINELQNLNSFQQFFNEIGMNQDKCQELYKVSNPRIKESIFLGFFTQFYKREIDQTETDSKCQRYFSQILSATNAMEKFLKLKCFELTHFQMKKSNINFETIIKENILIVLNQFINGLMEKSNVSIENEKIKQDLWESAALQNITEQEIEDWIIISKKIEEEIQQFE